MKAELGEDNLSKAQCGAPALRCGGLFVYILKILVKKFIIYISIFDA